MQKLNAISETALITLRCRVMESQKDNPVIQDPIGTECLQQLISRAKTHIENKILSRKLPASLTRHIAIRARKYDLYTKDFIRQHPDGLVVSLGSGFDTRYWRVSDQRWHYVELDLPEVMDIKSHLLADKISYPLIASSITDHAWIEKIATISKSHILFLAEGLLMYLPGHEVQRLFKQLSETFSASCFVFEVVREKYTKGFWKKIAAFKMQTSIGSSAGSAYQFGIKKATDIEKMGTGIHITDEWSYFEDRDIYPAWLHCLKNLKFFTRTQWTVKADFNHHPTH